MASSHRLDRRSLMTVAVMASLALAAAGVVVQAWREGEALSKIQLETLVRARWSDLEVNDYRGFVEGLGFDFRDVHVMVRSPEGLFESGSSSWPRVCSSNVYSSTSGSSKTIEVQLCRDFDSPVVPLFLIVLVTVTIAILLIMMTRREAVLSREAALSDLVKRVVHDLRSPIFIVQSLASSLTKQSQDEESKILKAAADRLSRICEDLLGEHRRRTQSIPSSDASDIESVVEMKKKEVSQRFAELAVQWDCRLEQGFSIPLNAHDTLRVLSNVLNNVVEAQGTGQLRISIKGTKIQDRLILSVTDNGPGMDRELLEDLQAGVFRSAGKGDGNGLGLKSVRDLITKSGGTLKIYSEKGKGTSVDLIWKLRA